MAPVLSGERIFSTDPLRVHRQPVKYLVDANVLSEPTKPSPDPGAMAWLAANAAEMATNAIVLGEIEYGILITPDGRKRRRLQEWFATGVQKLHMLNFDSATASAWARLLAGLRKAGKAMPIKDSLIAASALAFDLEVVTRNERDFRTAGVRVINPFTA